MGTGFECDIEKTFAAYCDLTAEEMKKAVKRALTKGAKKLVDKTKENAVVVIKTHNNPQKINGKLVTYSDQIEDGIMMTKLVDDIEEGMFRKVHVMGRRDKTSQTYKLRFLEKGTKERFIKKINGKPLQKPKSMGHIDARWFFRDAQNTVLPTLDTVYMEEIDKAINLINKKK